MSATREDVYKLIGYIEKDLRAINAKFTEVRSMLAAGAMTRSTQDALVCPRCGILLAGPATLRMHLANVHGGGSVPLSDEEAAA